MIVHIAANRKGHKEVIAGLRAEGAVSNKETRP
jgi:hypothetical protein